VRRALPIIVAVVFLAVGLVAGAMLFGDDDEPAPAETRVISAGEIPEPCEQALLVAEQTVAAAGQATAIAEAMVTSPPGSPSAPTQDVVRQAIAQAQGLRQQFATLQAACQQARGVAGTSTTTTSP
jgi:hypothetical protein